MLAFIPLRGVRFESRKEKADQDSPAGLRLAERVLIGLSIQGPMRS